MSFTTRLSFKNFSLPLSQADSQRCVLLERLSEAPDALCYPLALGQYAILATFLTSLYQDLGSFLRICPVPITLASWSSATT